MEVPGQPVPAFKSRDGLLQTIAAVAGGDDAASLAQKAVDQKRATMLAEGSLCELVQVSGLIAHVQVSTINSKQDLWLFANCLVAPVVVVDTPALPSSESDMTQSGKSPAGASEQPSPPTGFWSSVRSRLSWDRRSTRNPTQQPPRPRLTRELPSIGEIGYTSDEPVFIATSKAVHERLKTLALVNDLEGVKQLILLGLVYTVPKYTKVRVIDVDGYLDPCAEVRVLDEDHNGDLGYIPRRVLRKAQ